MMTANGTDSNTSGTPATDPNGYQAWQITTAVIISIICLLGIPANITVIMKLIYHLRGSSMSWRLFFSLAVSDLLCLLCLPFGVFIFYSKHHLTHGVCQLLIYFFLFCMTSDLNILVLISIQRYYQILHRDKWAKVTRIWQRLLLSSVWLLGALVALPVVFLLRDANTSNKNKVEKTDSHSCNGQRIAPGFELIYIFFIVFSQLVLLSFYVLLVRGLKRAQMPDKKQPKVDQLFIRIIAIFLVCSVFPLIFRMLYVAEGFSDLNKVRHVSKMLTFVECFYFINHCLNPFLYFFAARYHTTHSSNRRKHLFDDEC